MFSWCTAVEVMKIGRVVHLLICLFIHSFICNAGGKLCEHFSYFIRPNSSKKNGWHTEHCMPWWMMTWCDNDCGMLVCCKKQSTMEIIIKIYLDYNQYVI